MKKVLLAVLLVVGMIGLTTAVFADPGPYGPQMVGDGCDTNGPDGIPTPCQAGGNPEIYEAINQIFINAGLASPGLTSNHDTDAYQVTTANAYWDQFVGGAGAGNFAAIGITASHSNTLGVFLQGSAVPGSIVDVILPQSGFGYLGNGTTIPYPGGINPYSSGEDFGFALKSYDPHTNTNEIWYSDNSLNSDGIDHMLAFYLPQLSGVTVNIDTDGDGITDSTITFTADTYLLAFEDLHVNHRDANGNPDYDSDYNDTIFLVTRLRPIPEPTSMLLLGSGLMGLVGLRRKMAK